MLGEIDAIQGLHQDACWTIHLIHHHDCAGHGGSRKHASEAAERLYHQQEMFKAASLIRQRYPNLKIRIYFADFDAIRELPLEPIQ